MENKMKFRKGQRAWSMRSGWGTIINIGFLHQHPIKFKPNDKYLENYHIDGRWVKSDLMPTLFHKEQILDFSEPEIPQGTWGYFWDDENSIIAYGQLEKFEITCGYQIQRAEMVIYYEQFSTEIPPHIQEKQLK